MVLLNNIFLNYFKLFLSFLELFKKIIIQTHKIIKNKVLDINDF